MESGMIKERIEEVTKANELFYEAFESLDIVKMDRVWAQQDYVTCIHPGWNPLTGREAVMASWAGILGGGAPPNIRCLGPVAFVTGDTAFVICYESLDDGFLVATNIFVREAGGWHMVHHQAGQTMQGPPTGAEAAAGGTVH